MMRLFIALFLVQPAHLSADVLTSTRVIRPDTIIEWQDIAILPKEFPGAIESGKNIIGLETRNTLYPGRPIRNDDVGPVALVKRNQHVELVFRHGGLMISTEARALQRGAMGEFVRVMNLTSRTTVTGRVSQNGSVVVGGTGQ